jgi:hypothetical protein
MTKRQDEAAYSRARYANGGASAKEKVRLRMRSWRAKNPEKAHAKEVAWRKQNPDKVKGCELSRVYGISKAEYDKLHEEQEGLCAICRRPERMTHLGKLCRLSVDHDHRDNHVRGLLCRTCNFAIGALDDDPELLAAALRYLQLAP